MPVRRDKAALSSGCKSHPANAPARRVVEVRAQEHCDYASIVKLQGAFYELLRQSMGGIGDDRADTRLRCLTQEIHALRDVAPDHVETSLPLPHAGSQILPVNSGRCGINASVTHAGVSYWSSSFR